MRVQRNKRTGEYRADLDDSGTFVPVKVQRNKKTGEMRVIYDGQEYPYAPQASDSPVPKAAERPAEQATGLDYADPVNAWGKPDYTPPKVEQESGMSWGEVGKKALENALPSLGGVLRDVATAVMHPIDTAQNLGDLIDGLENKAVNALTGRKPGEEPTAWQKVFGVTDEDEAKANAVGNYLADRYGGIENIKRTLAVDPAGAAADAAGVLAGGSGVLRGAAGLGKLAGRAGATNALANAANALGSSAAYIDPVARSASLAGSALKNIVGRILPEMPTPERLYQSALKPVPSTEAAVRERLIETGLREKVLPTDEGLDKVLALRKELGGKVQNLIDENAALQRAGQAPMIDPERLVGGAIPYVYRQLGNSTRRGRQLKRADNALMEFLEEYPMPLDSAQAQRMKVRAQLEGQKDFGKSVSTPENEVNKALAHELKTAIENNIPEVAELNKRLGDLKVLAEPLERALGRTGNWELTSLTGNLGGIGGATLGGLPGAVAGAALGNISRSAVAKAKLAFILDSMRRASRAFQSRPAIDAMLRGMRLLNNPQARQALRSLAFTGGTMDTLQGGKTNARK